MKRILRRIRWFSTLVWRESTYTPPGMTWWRNRITIATAWEVAGILA